MKSFTTTIAIATFCASCFLTSCSKFSNFLIHAVTDQEDLEGVAPADTVTIEKQMTVDGSFSHIQLLGSYSVELIQSDSVANINFKGRKVYADNAILKVSGDTLYVKSKEDRFCRGAYVISVPKLESIMTSGAVDLKTENLQQTANLDITSAGAADIDIKNSSFGNLNITASGAADVKLKSVLMHNSNISTAGAGTVKMDRITADTIKADMNGAGELEASGNCKDFKCDLSGAGDINIDKLNIANKNAKKVENAINK